MRSKWIVATTLLIVCLAVGVWILSGSTEIIPAVLLVVGMAIAAQFAVRWGGSKARENEQAMQDLLSKRNRKNMDQNE